MNNPPDHYWPIQGRPTLVWQQGRKMAFYVEVNIEHFETGMTGTGCLPPFALLIDPATRAGGTMANGSGCGG